MLPRQTFLSIRRQDSRNPHDVQPERDDRPVRLVLDRLRHGSLELAVEPTDVAGLVERTVSALDTNGRRIELHTSPAIAEVDPATAEWAKVALQRMLDIT